MTARASILTAGAKRVLISAPAKGVDLTVVFGVNHDKLTAEHPIVSNASCTTNCLAPIAKVLNDAIGIERGLMTTIHSYTNDQKILDQIHPDPRRARAAAMSMIPTTTGAARAVGEVLPELKGKLDGSAIRVPTPNVSVVDLTFKPKRDTSVEEVNGVLRPPAEGAAQGRARLHRRAAGLDRLQPRSRTRSTVDSLETAVIDGKLVRVLSWYDNEWGLLRRPRWARITAAGDGQPPGLKLAAALPRLKGERRYERQSERAVRFRTLDDLGDVTGKRRAGPRGSQRADGRRRRHRRYPRCAPPRRRSPSSPTRAPSVLLLAHFGRPKGERVIRTVAAW